MTLHDTLTYAGEKGGANGDLIKNNPAFVRTRENMNEFNGCGQAVKAIRRGLQNLLPEQTDKNFTSRLMSIVKNVNLTDPIGLRGKRAISFSANRGMLFTLILSTLQDIADVLERQFANHVHPISRAEATLTLTDFSLRPVDIPLGATHYRVQNHISVISDYEYSEANRRYEPLSALNKMSAFTYSEYTPVKTKLTDDLVVSFPVGTVLTDDVTVIECVGIEFFQLLGADQYCALKGSSMMVIDVF